MTEADHQAAAGSSFHDTDSCEAICRTNMGQMYGAGSSALLLSMQALSCTLPARSNILQTLCQN